MVAIIAILLSLSSYAEDWPFIANGGITFYYNEFEGRPLGCYWPTMIYDCNELDKQPWAAFPLEWYEDGYYECGDIVVITFYDGSTMTVRAYDMCPGCLHSSVWDSGLPFVADLPKCWRNGMVTATGTVMNISALIRESILRVPY